MKFGKHLAGRQLELPEYNGHFVNYKALKKLIKQLSIPIASANSPNSSADVLTLGQDDNSLTYKRLQENKASFFFKLERELEKVNEYYMEKEADLKIKFELLQSRYGDFLKRGKLNSKKTSTYRQIRDGIKKFERDITHLEQFVELNRTGFSKVLKKWDKRSHSHTKDFYLATVVSVQPVFTRNKVSKWNDEVLAMLLELDEVSNDQSSIFHIDSTISTKTTVSANMTATTAATPYTADIDSATSSLVRSSPTTLQYLAHDNTVMSANGLFDIELEIESWYMEALHISRLKDDEPKLELLKSFAQTKVQSFVNEHWGQARIDKNMIIKEYLTKIFFLLVASNMDDVSLKHFLANVHDSVDLTQCDDEDLIFSRRNIFHEAANCEFHPRTCVLQEALKQYYQSLIPKEIMKKSLNAQDIYDRSPLHYACERGKTEFVKLLIESKTLHSFDLPDTESKTPLVLAIENNHIEIARILLVDAQVNPAPLVDEFSKPQFSPLSVACVHKNLAVAKLILEIGNINLNIVCDSQGLGPLHIVAKNGGNAELIELLVSYGADPNRIDSFNRWTPIFYAIYEGHENTVQEFLKHGASLDIVDGDNLSPLFYATWEGHLSVLNVLLQYLRETRGTHNCSTIIPPVKPVSVFAHDDQFSHVDSLNDIPDFELPPPIIPLRKYGHNFLEKKIFVKLAFQPSRGSISLNKEDEMVLSSPGRITLTSNVSDIIPRNIILPIQEDEDGVVVFQIDKLNDFSIDFEVFPSFGTRLIAKTSAMASIFNDVIKHSNNDGTVKLPLFDSRLKNVGELNVYFQVIFPYSGKPLEITKYETYWKSTGGGEPGPNGQRFVTSSSLSGNYITVTVAALSDGKLVAAPGKFVSVPTTGAEILLADLSSKQLEMICGKSLDDVPDIETIEQLKEVLSQRHMFLDVLLNKISPDIQLDIEAYFPTPYEINSVPVRVSPSVNINKFVDDVLFTTFSHIRYLNHNNMPTRSVVFSSCNPRVCSILNWKQPNYPVIYQMNGLRKQDGKYVRSTPHHLDCMALNPDLVSFDDACSRSIREVVNFATNNNLLGVVIPLELLRITPQLINQIRHRGLLLIGSECLGSLEEIPGPIDTDINAIKSVVGLEFI